MHRLDHRTPRRRTALLACVVLLLSLVPLATTAAPADPAPENSAAFQRTWARTDQPVADGSVARTWMWGPAPLGDPVQEAYAEAPGGTRTVLYYDKSRMEVTHPDGDRSSPWFVTNGLLAQELILGEMQVGDTAWEPRLPAEINIAGDQGFPNGPTYATFHRFLTTGEHHNLPAPRVGDLVRERIDAEGRVVVDERFAAYDVHVVPDETNPWRSVAAPFWEFMQSRGLVQINGALVADTLFPNPVYATGLPITEPYWAEVSVGGRVRDVLLQCFERRCLTYTPDNPPGWQVESGNIGQHYQQWRYTPPPQVEGELLFTRAHRDGQGGYCTNLYLVNVDGTNERQLIPDVTCNISDPQWSPDGSSILFTTDNDLFILRMATMDLLRLTNTPEQELDAVWSPDGTQIAASRSDDSGSPSLVLLQADGSGERLMTTESASASLWRSVAWSPDGKTVAFLRRTREPGTAEEDARWAAVVMQVDDAQIEVRVLWEVTGARLSDLVWTEDGGELLVTWNILADGAWSNADYFWYGGALLAIAVEAAEPTVRHLAGCLLTPPRLICVDGADTDGTIWATFTPQRAPDGSGVMALSAQPMFDIPEPRTWRVVGSSGLYVLDPASGAAQQLTHYGGFMPTWSPDGQHILFQHRSFMNTFMTNMVVVTSRDGANQWVVATNARDPQWRPTVVTVP